MKIEIVEEPIYKTVKSGTRKKTKYIADDGSVFSSQKDCVQYEIQVERNEKWEKIENRTFELENIPWVFYYAGDEGELETIKERILNKRSKIHGELKVGEWIGEYSDYSDDMVNYICTMSYIKEQIDDFLNKPLDKIK